MGDFMSIQNARKKRDDAIAYERNVLKNLVKALQAALDAYEADKSQTSLLGRLFKNGLTTHRQQVINELRTILQEGEFSAQQKSIPLDAYTIRENFAARLKQEDLSLFGLSGLGDKVVVVLQHPSFSYHTLHQLRETSHQANAFYKKEKHRQLKQNNTTQDTALIYEENLLLKEQQNLVQVQQNVLSVQQVVSNFTVETTQTQLEHERHKNQKLEERVERIEALLNTIVEQNSQLQLCASNLRDENKQLKHKNAHYKRQLLEKSTRPSTSFWIQKKLPQVSINYDLPQTPSQYAVHNEI
jgi:hypothetical protein